MYEMNENLYYPVSRFVTNVIMSCSTNVMMSLFYTIGGGGGS